MGEAKHPFDRGSKRRQFFKDKRKRHLFLDHDSVHGLPIIRPLGQIGPIANAKTFVGFSES